MKIYEKVVIDIESGNILEEVSYDYDGPISQLQTTTTTTTTTVPPVTGSVFIVPDGDVSIEWTPSGGSGGNYTRIDNGVDTPDDSQELLGTYNQRDRYTFPTPSFPGTAVRVRTYTRAKDAAGSELRLLVYNEGAVPPIGESEIASGVLTGTYANNYGPWIGMYKTPAELTQLELMSIVTNFAGTTYLSELMLEIQYFVDSTSTTTTTFTTTTTTSTTTTTTTTTSTTTTTTTVAPTTTTTCPCPSFDPHPVGYLTSNVTNALGIDVKGDYAYVGLGGGQQEFVVVDVSDRTNPTYVTKLDVSDGIMSSIGYVWIKGNYAYLVGSSQYLQVIDISNPLSPSKVYDLDLSALVSGYSNIGLRIIGKGDYLYVSGGNGVVSNRFIAIDISTPNVPVYVTHEEVFCRGSSIKEGTDTIYVCGGSPNSELTIFNFDSTSLTTIGFADGGDISDFTGAAVQDIAYGDGDYLYVNARANSNFLVLDVSNPASISKVTNLIDLTYDGHNMVYWCDRVFVANDDTGTGPTNGLGIFDVTTPASPSFSQVTYTNVNTPRGLTLQPCASNYIYVVENNTNQVVVFDLDAVTTTTTTTTTSTVTTTLPPLPTTTTTTVTTTSTTITWPPGVCVEEERYDPRWTENYFYSDWPQEYTFQSDHNTKLDHCGTFRAHGTLGYYPGDFEVDMRFELSRPMKTGGVDSDYIGLAVDIEGLKTVTIVLTSDGGQQKARRLDSDGCIFSEDFGTRYLPTEVWLRISRTGSDFFTYYSYDRVKWYEITVASPQTYSGLVTIHFGAYHRTGGNQFEARYQFWTLWPDGPSWLESGAYLPHLIESDNFDDNDLNDRWFKRHGTYFRPVPSWAEGCIWEADQVMKVLTSPDQFHGPYNEFDGTWAWQDVKGFFNLTVKVMVNPALVVDEVEMGIIARELPAEGEPSCRIIYTKESGIFYFKRVDTAADGSESESSVGAGILSEFWLGLRWYKDGFTASYSLNGINWDPIAAPAVPITPTNWLQVGCAAKGWVSPAVLTSTTTTTTTTTTTITTTTTTTSTTTTTTTTTTTIITTTTVPVPGLCINLNCDFDDWGGGLPAGAPDFFEWSVGGADTSSLIESPSSHAQLSITGVSPWTRLSNYPVTLSSPQDLTGGTLWVGINVTSISGGTLYVQDVYAGVGSTNFITITTPGYYVIQHTFTYRSVGLWYDGPGVVVVDFLAVTLAEP